MGQVVLDTATNLNSGLKITDSQSGFRAYAGYVKSVFQFKENGMVVDSEMLAEAVAAGLRV
ncbi:MAG: hypothetical protein MUO26_15160 [Methanotrichaceae archaeon]|nr:hypothetical protein [Methanotrichaceae archaeon]